MPGNRGNIPSLKAESPPPVRPEQQGVSRLPIESKAQLCMGLIWQRANLSSGS